MKLLSQVKAKGKYFSYTFEHTIKGVKHEFKAEAQNELEAKQKAFGFVSKKYKQLKNATVTIS